jgi:hypothetical protein
MPASEIHIRATETDPEVVACTVVREAHQRLRTRLAALIGAGSVPGAGQPLPAELVDFCLYEVRQYLVAADRHLYVPASGGAGTLLPLEALRAGASALNGQIDGLAAANSVDASWIGRMIAATLDLQLQIEDSVLLPALAGLPGVDLSLLAADLRAFLEGSGSKRRRSSTSGGSHAVDVIRGSLPAMPAWRPARRSSWSTVMTPSRFAGSSTPSTLAPSAGTICWPDPMNGESGSGGVAVDA